MKAVPASAKIEELRREDTCNLAESSLYTVADPQSFGFGLPTSLMKPPWSLFAAARFSNMRPETVGLMAKMTSTGPGKDDGTAVGPDADGGSAGDSEGNPDGSVVRIGVGKGGTKLGGCAVDVIVVTTPPPPNGGYPYDGVSRGAR